MSKQWWLFTEPPACLPEITRYYTIRLRYASWRSWRFCVQSIGFRVEIAAPLAWGDLRNGLESVEV